MPQQHYAGEKLFADYAGQTVPILDRNGGIAFKANIFVAVLGASNYTYACASRSEATPDWIGGLIDAMEFYGGVPRLLVPDNPRALISNADRYEPTLGLTTQDFVSHYDTAMLPARPRKPKDKAKVEVGVQFVERWILARLRHHRFYSLAELNKAISGLIPTLFFGGEPMTSNFMVFLSERIEHEREQQTGWNLERGEEHLCAQRRQLVVGQASVRE